MNCESQPHLNNLPNNPALEKTTDSMLDLCREYNDCWLAENLQALMSSNDRNLQLLAFGVLYEADNFDYSIIATIPTNAINNLVNIAQYRAIRLCINKQKESMFKAWRESLTIEEVSRLNIDTASINTKLTQLKIAIVCGSFNQKMYIDLCLQRAQAAIALIMLQKIDIVKASAVMDELHEIDKKCLSFIRKNLKTIGPIKGELIDDLLLRILRNTGEEDIWYVDFVRFY